MRSVSNAMRRVSGGIFDVVTLGMFSEDEPTIQEAPKPQNENVVETEVKTPTQQQEEEGMSDVGLGDITSIFKTKKKANPFDDLLR